VYSSAAFTGARVVPLGIRKLETLGYPMVKTATLCSLILAQYRSVTDGQTDG